MCNLNFGTVPEWLVLVTGIISLSFLKEYVDDTSKIRIISEAQFKLSETNSFKQSVDDHFFNLLNGYYNLINSLKTECYRTREFVRDNQFYIGKDCLKHLAESISTQISIPTQKLDGESNKTFQDRIAEIFKPFYEKNSENLSHYYRYLYNFFKYIDENSGTESEKYINLLKANISDFEFELIFLNGLTQNGVKFKKIIEDHALFENWFRDSNPSTTFKALKEIGLYSRGAFKQ